jgi:hypothetical protein
MMPTRFKGSRRYRIKAPDNGAAVSRSIFTASGQKANCRRYTRRNGHREYRRALAWAAHNSSATAATIRPRAAHPQNDAIARNSVGNVLHGWRIGFL